MSRTLLIKVLPIALLASFFGGATFVASQMEWSTTPAFRSAAKSESTRNNIEQPAGNNSNGINLEEVLARPLFSPERRPYKEPEPEPVVEDLPPPEPEVIEPEIAEQVIPEEAPKELPQITLYGIQYGNSNSRAMIAAGLEGQPFWIKDGYKNDDFAISILDAETILISNGQQERKLSLSVDNGENHAIK